MASDEYTWSEREGASPKPGSWNVVGFRDGGGAYVAVDDCGCCGDVDVLQVKSVEEFDAEWKRIGKMLRTHVRRAVKKGQK